MSVEISYLQSGERGEGGSRRGDKGEVRLACACKTREKDESKYICSPLPPPYHHVPYYPMLGSSKQEGEGEGEGPSQQTERKRQTSQERHQRICMYITSPSSLLRLCFHPSLMISSTSSSYITTLFTAFNHNNNITYHSPTHYSLFTHTHSHTLRHHSLTHHSHTTHNHSHHSLTHFHPFLHQPHHPSQPLTISTQTYTIDDR